VLAAVAAERPEARDGRVAGAQEPAAGLADPAR